MWVIPSGWHGSIGKAHHVSLELVKLTVLMERTSGSPEVKIGLIDGPVATRHLSDERIRELPNFPETTALPVGEPSSAGCEHRDSTCL
jgi:hypothetical protein